jgi:uncharacterized protein (TIGR03083 family)
VPTMGSDTVWQHIDSEWAWMADFLESLPPGDWQRPSLCTGWTVRDVGAHLTFAQTPVRDLLWPALRAGFRYDVLVRDTALGSLLTHKEIVAKLRSFLGSRRRVAFITDLEPLIDILVHNQDIARPLGVDHPIPPDAAAAAADRVLAPPSDPALEATAQRPLRGHRHRLGLRQWPRGARNHGNPPNDVDRTPAHPPRVVVHSGLTAKARGSDRNRPHLFGIVETAGNCLHG